ncbi:MAG TPA: hypothetical protein VFJ68_09040 [Casimicrobiaceae bacterium]|nr:hypothetical protein [Casimicrobiaceae bacterium]
MTLSRKNKKFVSASSIAIACAAGNSPLYAGQPLVTDDAAIVAPGTCQLEAWYHPTHDGHEYWAQPACNFTGNLELAVGVARSYPDDDPTSSLIHLQAKTVLFPRDDGQWSFGVVGSGDRDTGAAHGRTAFQAFNVTGLASWYPREDLEIDLNLGVSYQYGSGTFAFAAAAVQYAVIETVQLLAEVFHDEPGRAKFQVGVRGIVVPDRFEVYASYGNPFNAARWFATLGIRLQTPEFLR